MGLWQSPTANAGGTTTYAAYAELYYGWSNGVFGRPTLTAAIDPYSQIGGNFSAPAPYISTNANGGQVVQFNGNFSNCAWTDAGACGSKQDFSPGTFASMTIRVTNSISGWFFGRLQQPSLNVQSFDSASQLLTVTGQAASVPAFEAFSQFPKLSPAFQAYFSSLSYVQPLFSGLVQPVAANGLQAFNAID